MDCLRLLAKPIPLFLDCSRLKILYCFSDGNKNDLC